MTDSTAATYIELSVAVDGEAAEAVCELFERHGGGAVVEVLLRAGVADGADLPVPRTRVTTYIPEGDTEARARLEVGLWHLGRILPIPDATTRRLTAADWAEAWKAHYTPQRIGPFLIVPSWLEAATSADDLVIRLDPGMAFGTGLHPSTRLCLVALAELVTSGATVLDVGTGSGILAIAARRLGAASAVGLDIDAAAVAIAADNAERNGVAVTPFAGPLGDLPPGVFDLVVANILAGTLCALAPQLWARTRPGGAVLVSGILAEQADTVSDALMGAGFGATTARASGDWVALVARRPAAP